LRFSGVAAFLLRFDFGLPPAYTAALAYALPIWIVVKAVVFRVANLDRGWWRYVSIADLLRIVAGNFAGSALSCIAILLIAPAGIPALDLLAGS
jgi:FlaA1/EpsC-like NDP-sugar epimerase